MKISLRLLFTLLLAVVFLPVLTFAQNEKKAAYGILIDNTGTMRSHLSNVQILANAVAQRSAENGLVSLFSFETQGKGKKSFAKVTNGTDWSQDKKAFEKHIVGIEVVPGQTVLFDAIRSIAQTTKAKAETEKLSEKVIVLITDGEDRASEISEKQLIKELKENGVKVFVIGLVADLYNERSFFGDSPKAKATKFLKKITEETEGNIIFPEIKKETEAEVLLNQLFAKSDSK